MIIFYVDWIVQWADLVPRWKIGIVLLMFWKDLMMRSSFLMLECFLQNDCSDFSGIVRILNFGGSLWTFQHLWKFLRIIGILNWFLGYFLIFEEFFCFGLVMWIFLWFLEYFWFFLRLFLRLQVLWIFGFQWYFWYFQGCMGFTYTPDAAIRHQWWQFWSLKKKVPKRDQKGTTTSQKRTKKGPEELKIGT